MAKYEVTWSGLDSGGREGTWKPSQWLGVLEILSRYDGHSYTDLESPMYDELEQRFPKDTWRSSGHSMFRDYRYAWARTDLVQFEDNVVRRYLTLVQVLAQDGVAGNIIRLCELWDIEPALVNVAPAPIDHWETLRKLAQHVVEYHREQE